ncbi:MAG: VWA domain-containing protein [Pseudonocardiales bacterium]
MAPRPGFGLKVSQESYLATGDDTMDAILRVFGQDLGTGSGVAPEAAQVILVDCSGSMSVPPTKIAAARRATAAAIDTLRDGAYFAIVAGTEKAEPKYPPPKYPPPKYPSVPHMAKADAQTKAEAKAIAAGLVASGGTAMGTWLTLARKLLDEHPTAVRHALLLTDGKNQEHVEYLNRALNECAGRFVCDARGIGTDWEPRELRRIVEVLRGHADAVCVDSELAADFQQITETVMSKVVPDVRIRVRLMPGTKLRFLKKVFPEEQDLTTRPTALNEGTMEFSIGSWSPQDSHDYHLCLDVDHEGKPKDEDIQVAVVELAAVVAGTTAAQRCGSPSPIIVHWTDDLIRSIRVDPSVAHYTGQAKINRAITVGCDAYEGGRRGEAAQEWGRAVKLAAESGNAEILKRMRRLVEITDAAKGVVTIKPELKPEDLLRAAVGSGLSTRSRELHDGMDHVSGPVRLDLTCAKCGRVSPGNDRFCGCGELLSEHDEPDGGSAGERPEDHDPVDTAALRKQSPVDRNSGGRMDDERRGL